MQTYESICCLLSEEKYIFLKKWFTVNSVFDW